MSAPAVLGRGRDTQGQGQCQGQGRAGAGQGQAGLPAAGPSPAASRQMVLSGRRTGVGLPRHLANTLRVSCPRLPPASSPWKRRVLHLCTRELQVPMATAWDAPLPWAFLAPARSPRLLQALMSRAASRCRRGRCGARQPQPAARCRWAEAVAAVAVGGGCCVDIFLSVV